ncbi:hypothetical protein V5O48_000465 [Marasmius crinis-equi]|uniref:Transmembrane protein n=1 Tax=Marasmius crinis-equi TaxID=585013 RepID=A0ABR3G130_9AGAR
MADSFEMKELSAGSSKQQDDSESDTSTPPTVDGTLSLWSWTSAICITVFAGLLIIFPQFLLFVSQAVPSSSMEYRTNLTPLESFLATHFALWLLALGASLVLNIPLAHPPIARNVADPEHPLLMPVTLASILSAFLAYNTTSVGSLAMFYFLLTSSIGLWGLWALVFHGPPKLSKKTGADKRTSAFIFGNRSAASKQKKKWRQEHKDS